MANNLSDDDEKDSKCSKHCRKCGFLNLCAY